MFVAVSIGQIVVAVRISDNSSPKPYFVERDEQSGATYYSGKYVGTFTPTADNNTYFLRKWATRVFTINLDVRDILKRQIPLAHTWTSGATTRELGTYITKADPAAQHVVNTPGLTRQLEDNSILLSTGGNIAYMIVILIESITDARQTSEQKLLTISFPTVPQQLKPGDRKDSPTGMRTTGLSITPYTGITSRLTK